MGDPKFFAPSVHDLSWGNAAYHESTVQSSQMRSVIFFFSELIDQDMDWIRGVGDVIHVDSSEQLVTFGQDNSDLLILIEGSLEVLGQNGTHLANLEAGSVIGEISFLDSRPASATIRASEDCTVLSLDHRRVSNRLETDAKFAARFYRSVGILLAHRLRDANLAIAAAKGASVDDEEAGEFSPEMFDRVDIAAARFDLLRQSVRKSVRGGVDGP